MKQPSRVIGLLIVLGVIGSVHAIGCVKDNGDPLHVSFLFLPLRGHVNPIIGLAEELVDQGCHVTFPISEGKAHWVNRGGVTPLPIVLNKELGDMDDMPLESRSKISQEKEGVFEKIKALYNMATDDSASGIIQGFIYIQQPVFRYVREAHTRGEYTPDVIVTEKLCQLCVDAADIIGIPHVLFDPSLIQDGRSDHYIPTFGIGFPLDMTWTQRIFSQLRSYLSNKAMMKLFAGSYFTAFHESQGVQDLVSPYFAIEREDTYEIVATCFGFEYPRPILPLTKLVGPLVPRQLNELPSHLKEWIESDQSNVIYMCMGTVVTITTEMSKHLLSAMENKEYRVLWSLPDNQRDILNDITLPSNFRMESFVPQRELLQHPQVKGFISHTGASSSNEAMLAGVPVICMPFFGDQYDYCQRIVELGAGFRLDKSNLDSSEISQYIERVLHDDSIKSKANEASQILQCGGSKAAADIIFDFFENGCEHLIPFNQKLEGAFWREGYDITLFTTTLVALLTIITMIGIRIFIVITRWILSKMFGRAAIKQKNE